MGGKTGTTTQSVQIPPEVLARYNAVNARAETTAQQPFQQYSASPESFVAQINPQQQAGISNINQQAMAAQPAYQAAMQGTAGAYGGLSPQGFQQGVAGYMNPFVNQAMGATAAQMQNVNQQQQQQLVGQGVSAGAFGGDRGRIARAALANQQNLALGQTLGQMASQGYQGAAQNYLTGMGQQGQLAAQMGALGAGAQQAGLQGAQAQIGAGTLGQQTEQAGKTAMYNQFLQQQAYPFQVAQFLANIAMGTGALSGSQTTTTQPMSFFSDRRLKEDIKRIGESDEGLPIYKFKYKGDPNEQTHVGFMADEVEKVHPEAVGHSHGYKTVDYDKAAKSFGGIVVPERSGEGFGLGGAREHHAYGSAVGGGYDPYDPYNIYNILSSQKGMFSEIDRHHVPLARDITGGLGKHGRVPQANLPVGSLMKAGAIPQNPDDLGQAVNRAQQLSSLGEMGIKYKEKYDAWKKEREAQQQAEAQKGRAPEQGFSSSGQTVGQGKLSDASQGLSSQEGQSKLSSNNFFSDLFNQVAATGGRIGYDFGGNVTPPNETKKDDSTPEGLYSAEPTGKLNIPIEMKNYNLARQSTLPGAMQDPTMRDIMTIIGLFKSHGGSIGREHHDGSEGNVVGGASELEKKLGLNPVTNPVPTPAEEKGATNFGRSIHRVLQFEGGLNPSDTNGTPSKFGINKAANPDVYDSIQTPSDASQVYYNRYWKPLGADQMDPNLAHVAFDTAVIAGVPKAKELIAAANGDPQKLLELRKNFQDNLIANNPEKYGKYENAWNRRINQLSVDISNKIDFPEGKEPGLAPSEPKEAMASVAPSGKKEGFGDFFTAENVVPVLTGLAGMASSRSPFLGSAILEGLGAGAQAYLGTRKSLADIAQSEAATKAMEQETSLKGAIIDTGYGKFIFVKNKQTGQPDILPIEAVDWSKYIPISPPATGTADILRRHGLSEEDIKSTTGIGGAGGLSPTTGPGAATAQPTEGASIEPPKINESAQNDYSDFLTAQANRPTIIEANRVYRTSVNSAANSARNLQQTIREQANTLADVAASTGVNVAGAFRMERGAIANLVNAVARGLTGKPIEGLNVDNTEQVLNKLTGLQGSLAASEAGQQSLGALTKLIEYNANGNMSPEAFAPLMATIIVQNKRAMDQQNHMNSYDRVSHGNFQRAGSDFNQKNDPVSYGHAIESISKLMLADPALFKDAMNGKVPAELLNKFGKQNGVDNLSEYFRGI